MKTFYTIEGSTGTNHRHTLEEVTKIAQRQAARGTGDVIILKSYAVADQPITNVTLTPTEDN